MHLAEALGWRVLRVAGRTNASIRQRQTTHAASRLYATLADPTKPVVRARFVSKPYDSAEPMPTARTEAMVPDLPIGMTFEAALLRAVIRRMAERGAGGLSEILGTTSAAKPPSARL